MKEGGSFEEFSREKQEEMMDEMSELELADAIERENEFKKEIEDREKRKFVILGIFDKDYFDAFSNKIEELRETNDALSNEKIEKIIGRGVLDRVIRFLDKAIPDLADSINDLIRKEHLNVSSERCSLQAVLTNSVIEGFGGVRWLMEKIGSDNPVIQNKINDPESNRMKIIRNFKKSFGTRAIPYYFRELCRDKGKLRLELTTVPGYISRFREYFFDSEKEIENDLNQGKNYPLGGGKLPYFHLFSELEKGGIKDEDHLNRELDRLDEKIIKKDAIRADFRNRKFVG